MGLTLPPITEGITADTSPLWQALAKRRGKQPVYLLACLRDGVIPDLRLLPKAPFMRIARDVLTQVQQAHPGTYIGALTMYQRMWASCRVSGRAVLTRPEVFAMQARESSEKAMLKYLRALVVAGLVTHIRGHAVHWYGPVKVTRDTILPNPDRSTP